ncbi:PEPxxWA-CTERM sorting domain-containing protein [Sphingomonas flavalba]|uniref:PEPxxWA-CTERM sorting domain-containing protein n=1 Tax=Sphingomonas flavalba TaxID=2559804 RepID=UPI001EF0E3F6|nr:PEPxxWA-CTERM sorting domain-containing protein [Sphingomonas flavalba]
MGTVLGSGTIYIPVEFAKHYALEVSLDEPADYLYAELRWDEVTSNNLYPGGMIYNSINPVSLFADVKVPGRSYSASPLFYITGLGLSVHIDGYSSNIPINYSISITDITQTPVQTPVPEPATWAMLIVGFGVIGGLSRSRRVRTTFSHA